MGKLVGDTIKDNTFKIIRFYSDNFKLICNLIVYKISKKSKTLNETIMLVIGSTDYVWVSIHCIVSFFRYNPNSKMLIYVDDKTYRLARILYFFIDRKNIKLSKIDSYEIPPLWVKAKLILEIQGSYKFFMDADLRWNSSLPEMPSNKIIVFAKEFELTSSETHSRLISKLSWSTSAPIYMFNTSFFCWNAENSGMSFGTFVNFLSQFNTIKSDYFDLFFKDENLFRLSEQISLSYIIRNFQVEALDELMRNQSLRSIESTYFGATGHRFGR